RGADPRRPRPRRRTGGRGGLAPGDRLGGVPAERRRSADARRGCQESGRGAGRKTAKRSEGAVMASRVWVVVQLRDGQVSRISWEAVAAAQRLAAMSETGGGKAEAVVLGSGSAIAAAAADLAKADLAAVHTADHEALRAYTPGGWIGALAPALKEAQ